MYYYMYKIVIENCNILRLWYLYCIATENIVIVDVYIVICYSLIYCCNATLVKENVNLCLANIIA